MIEERIAFADHVVAGIRSERQLAEELGLSRSTVRKALEVLVEKGTLNRQANGRLDVAEVSGAYRIKTVGFVAPVGTNVNRDEWRETLNGVVEGLGLGPNVVIRSVAYGHWADPVIQEALANLDGAFFMTNSASMPGWLLTKIVESPCKIVFLNNDQTAAGIPSVNLFPAKSEHKLFDYLVRLGHRAIDCLNTQKADAVIEKRISEWESYVHRPGFRGRYLSLEQHKPVESAYRLVRDTIGGGEPLATALFCTTGPAAIGAMRAILESGLRVGHDVSVCAVNSEGLGRYLNPTLTALEAPPRALYLRSALEWMIGAHTWRGPLLVQPEDLPLFEGESTGPAPDAAFGNSLADLAAASGLNSADSDGQMVTSKSFLRLHGQTS